MVTDTKTREKIREDYQNKLNSSTSSSTAIMHMLAAKYDKAYSTIHKIINDGYKIPTGKCEKFSVLKQEKREEKKISQFSKTLIFTSWEIRVGINKKFIDLLKQIKNYYDATVYVSVLWPNDLEFLPPDFEEFEILTNDLKINNNISFKYVPTHALSMSPISGWSGAHDHSIIIPGLVKELSTEKSIKLCKQIITTGSIGKLNAFLDQYNHIEDEDLRSRLVKRWSFVQNRRGGRTYEIARQFTVPSALIVDIKDTNTFFTRFITMEKDGVVYDKDLKFSYGKSEPEKSKPSAIVFGDQHAWIADKKATEASLEMLKSFKPENIVLNDFFDGASVNHHEWDDFYNVVEFPSIEQEAELTIDLLSKFCEDKSIKVYYRQSNHDDFLIKYLASENNYKYGKNYKKAIELRLWQLENRKHPIIKVLELYKFKNLIFSPSKENISIAGVTILHGHEGIAGRRVGFAAQQRIYNRLVIGHCHVPGIYRNGAVCGTNSELNPSYTIGASGWLAANVLVQPDGSLQLLPIINGQWQL